MKTLIFFHILSHNVLLKEQEFYAFRRVTTSSGKN